MGKKGSLKNKLSGVAGCISKNKQNSNLFLSPKQTDITKQGDLVTIQTIAGNEVGMVLNYKKKNQLRQVLKDLNVHYDESSEIWKHNYSVLGHYKASDIDYILKEQKYNEYPKINILIMKVNSKSDYNLVVGRSPEMLLLIDTLRYISERDKEIPRLMNELLNSSVMHLATKDMSKTYQKELEKKKQLKEQGDDSIAKDSSSEIE